MMIYKNAAGIMIIFIAFCLIGCPVSNADVICLKNGGRINGVVIKDNGRTVTIDIGGGTVVQNKQDIARIEKGEPDSRERGHAASARIKAPAPKKTVGEVVSAIFDGVKSIMRFDFLRKSK